MWRNGRQDDGFSRKLSAVPMLEEIGRREEGSWPGGSPSLLPKVKSSINSADGSWETPQSRRMANVSFNNNVAVYDMGECSESAGIEGPYLFREMNKGGFNLSKSDMLKSFSEKEKNETSARDRDHSNHPCSTSTRAHSGSANFSTTTSRNITNNELNQSSRLHTSTKTLSSMAISSGHNGGRRGELGLRTTYLEQWKDGWDSSKTDQIIRKIRYGPIGKSYEVFGALTALLALSLFLVEEYGALHYGVRVWRLAPDCMLPWVHTGVKDCYEGAMALTGLQNGSYELPIVQWPTHPYGCSVYKDGEEGSVIFNEDNLVAGMVHTRDSKYSSVCHTMRSGIPIPIEVTWAVEIILAGVVLTDLITSIYLYSNLKVIVMQWYTWVDVAALVGVVLLFARDRRDEAAEGVLGSGQFGFVVVIRILRLARILKLYKMMAITRQGTVAHEVNLLIYTVLVLILIMTAMAHILDPEVPLLLHNVVYFTVITLTTVGYGDIYPQSGAAHMGMCGFMMVAAVILPWRVGSLLAKFKLSKPAYHKRPTLRLGSPHVVIMGMFDVDRLKLFFEEFFDPAKDYQEAQVCMIHPAQPSKEMRVFIHGRTGNGRAHYVHGDPLIPEDLQLVDINSARAVFIFTDFGNLSNTAAEAEDARIALYVASIRSVSRTVLIYSQLLKRRSQPVVESLGANQLVSIIDLRSHLLASSVACNGACTLLCNLLTVPPELKPSKPQNDKKAEANPKKKGKEKDWLEDYNRGRRYQLVEVKSLFTTAGMEFEVLWHKLYEINPTVMLIGVHCELLAEVYMNPKGYMIEIDDTLLFLATDAKTPYTMIKGLSTTSSNPNMINITYKQVRKLIKGHGSWRRREKSERSKSQRSRVSSYRSEAMLGWSPTYYSRQKMEDRSFPLFPVATMGLTANMSYQYQIYLEGYTSSQPNFYISREPTKKVGMEGLRMLSDSIDLKNHVIVFGDDINYVYFVTALRSLTLHRWRTIVFVPGTPSGLPSLHDDEISQLSCFDEVYFCPKYHSTAWDYISPVTAHAMIFLAGDDIEEGDISSVFHVFKLQDMPLQKSCTYMACLRDTHQIKYLERDSLEDAIDPRSHPTYTRGRVYMEEMADRLLVNLAFRTHSIDFLRAFSVNPGHKSEERECKCFLIRFPQYIIRGECRDGNGWTFQALVKELMRTHNILPIGLLKKTQGPGRVLGSFRGGVEMDRPKGPNDSFLRPKSIHNLSFRSLRKASTGEPIESFSRSFGAGSDINWESDNDTGPTHHMNIPMSDFGRDVSGGTYATGSDLGLDRDITGAGEAKGNRTRQRNRPVTEYVSTMPDPDQIIKFTDYVYVLAPKEPPPDF